MKYSKWETMSNAIGNINLEIDVDDIDIFINLTKHLNDLETEELKEENKELTKELEKLTKKNFADEAVEIPK